MTASETQPTAVLRDSKAVSSTMSGFERRSLRANLLPKCEDPSSQHDVLEEFRQKERLPVVLSGG